MKRIMAVYDADPFYADRFAEFVNQKEAAFHAVAFTSLARLRAFSEQQRIEMLLVGDEVEEEALEGIRAEQLIRLGEQVSGKGGENSLQISGHRQCPERGYVLLSGEGTAGTDGNWKPEEQDNRCLFSCRQMRQDSVCIYTGTGFVSKQQDAFFDTGGVLCIVCAYRNGI